MVKLLPSLTVFALYVAFILGSTTMADMLASEEHLSKSGSGWQNTKQ